MQTSEQINELAAALAKAQGLIRPASKDAVNPGFKSANGKMTKYADLAAVWEVCRQPLADHGLSIVQLPTEAEPGRVALITRLMHASGQYIQSTFSLRLVQDTPQGAGSALTYLRRYALAAMVGVVADDDDDGNAASGRQPQAESRTNGASYTPPAAPQRPQPGPDAARSYQSNVLPAGQQEVVPSAQSRRANILARIAERTKEAEALDLEVKLLKPLKDMTDDELIAHGSNLAAAIKQAQAQTQQSVAA